MSPPLGQYSWIPFQGRCNYAYYNPTALFFFFCKKDTYLFIWPTESYLQPTGSPIFIAVAGSFSCRMQLLGVAWDLLPDHELNLGTIH